MQHPMPYGLLVVKIAYMFARMVLHGIWLHDQLREGSLWWQLLQSVALTANVHHYKESLWATATVDYECVSKCATVIAMP